MIRILAILPRSTPQPLMGVCLWVSRDGEVVTVTSMESETEASSVDALSKEEAVIGNV